MMKSNSRIWHIGTSAVLRGGKALLVIALVLLVWPVGSLANGTSGYGSPSAASSVRSATVPLSSYQSGLVSKPNPVDASANLVVTGNVGAGKHFRDDVPYRSTTSMYAPLGSTSLDSFMRYTAPAETVTTSAGTYRPFHSSSGTVATLQPGTRSIFVPNASRTATGATLRPVDTTRDALHSNTSFRILSPGRTDAAPAEDGLGTVPRLRLWPLSQKPEAVTPAPAETLTSDDYHRQMETLQQRLGEVNAEAAQLEQSVTAPSEPSAAGLVNPNWGSTGEKASAIAEGPRRDELLQETARLLAGTTGLPAAPLRQQEIALSDSEPDAPSEMPSDTQQRLQLYDPSRVLAPTGGLGPQPVKPRQSSGTAVSSPQSRYGLEGFGAVSAAPRALETPTSDVQSANRPSDLNASIERIAPEAVVVQPSVQSPIRKVDEELAATSVKEFARHLRLAERYFQRRAYQNAAHAYALAIGYCPTDPRAHLGQSHALLATGRYDASAAALAKAVELDPQFVLKKADLVEIVGGPDAFIACFNDLDEAVQASEAPMLQFLLAYIYYQMDRPVEARAAIEAAQAILPSSISIDSLKAAISRQ